MNAVEATAPLFVPGNRPDRFVKAAASGADAVIIDLEDAVAAADKDAARANLAALAAYRVPVIVRVNGCGSRWHRADVQAATAAGAAALMLPKCESANDLTTLRTVAGPELPLFALVETAAGLAAVDDIAATADRLAFGSIDFCADVGCAHTDNALLFARSRIVLASRLAGLIPPLDGITAAIDNPDALRRAALLACELGFGGKMCIHPAQTAAVRAAFRPTPEQVSWALKVVAAGDDDGAAMVDGAMVDAPVRRIANSILARRSD